MFIFLAFVIAISQASSRCSWATAILQKGGWSTCNNNMIAMLGWMQGEGSPCNNNPLDTTQNYAGDSDCNSVGVKNYPSMTAGVAATVQTMTNGYYGSILGNLKGCSNPITTASAIASSPWGTHDAVGATQYCQGNYNACCNDGVP